MATQQNKKENETIFRVIEGYQLKEQLNSPSDPSEICSNLVFNGNSLKGKFKQVIIKVTKKIDKNGFCNEHKLINEVSRHPNIINIIDYFLWNDMHFMVTEKILYCDLFDYVTNRKALGDVQTKNISFQLISAVEYLHSKMIAHMDVKLENIMVSNISDLSGNIISPNKLFSGINHENTIVSIKLIDFDLSLKINSHKKTNHWCGTPCYVFNEITERKPNFNAFKADIFATGVCIYAMKHSNFPCYQINKDEPTVFYDDCNVHDEILNDLFKQIFVPEEKRISLRQIFEHQWFSDVIYTSFCEPIEPIQEINNKIIDIMTFHDYDKETVIEQIKKGGSCLENSLYMYLLNNN